MQERGEIKGVREQIVGALNKWESASRKARESHYQRLEKTDSEFAEIPMPPVIRRVLEVHRSVIRSFTVDEVVDAAEISEKFSGIVRRALTPKK